MLQKLEVLEFSPIAKGFSREKGGGLNPRKCRKIMEIRL
jgi:hypothetical protein